MGTSGATVCLPATLGLRRSRPVSSRTARSPSGRTVAFTAMPGAVGPEANTAVRLRRLAMNLRPSTLSSTLAQTAAPSRPRSWRAGPDRVSRRGPGDRAFPCCLPVPSAVRATRRNSITSASRRRGPSRRRRSATPPGPTTYESESGVRARTGSLKCQAPYRRPGCRRSHFWI